MAVYVNGKHILSSPFKVKFIDGAISPKFTYSKGEGLKVGTAGTPSFFELFAFDLENNSENKSSSAFMYSISGANSLYGNLLPCPVSVSAGTSYVCEESYGTKGHYYGIFTPTYRGTIQIDVYLKHNASDWINQSPKNIKGLSLWLDGYDPLGNKVIPQNEVSISVWKDKSGNSRDTRLTAGTAPIYETKSNSLIFSSPSSVLSVDYSSSPSAETLFLVIEFTTLSGQQILFSGDSNNQRQYVLHSDNIIYLGKSGTSPSSGSVNGGVILPNVKYLLEYTYNTTLVQFHQAGSLKTSGTPATTYSSGGNICNIGAMNARVYELLVYNVSLTSTDRQTVESYLMNKWGIVSSIVPLNMYSPLQESPYFAYINSASPKAENTVVLGTLYDNIAGTDAFVDLQLKDEFFNDLEFGGYEIELALLCVAEEWGTINTLANPHPGNVGATPNSYHYQGFFAGLPRFYGDCIDRSDGSYICKYNIPSTGQYVLRISVEEPGVNATYFNGTDLGHLSNFDFNKDALNAELMGDPINLGNTISWTGDISGPQGLNGQRKFGSYFDKFKSRVENDINFNWSVPASSPVKWNYESYTPFSNFDTVTSLGYNQSKFRQEYWSVRYTGRIFPSYAEEYIFSMILDSDSEVNLYLGGRGFAINSSDDDSRKLVFKANSSANVKGVYHFSDTSPRDFTLEYVHRSGPSYATLYWQSPSTPYQVVPKEAFTHWRNATHRNLTIHPNALSPHHSTVITLTFNL